jgi:hypothetical protein
MKISFQYFYQTCHAVPDFIANKAFSVLQPAHNTYSLDFKPKAGQKQ